MLFFPEKCKMVETITTEKTELDVKKKQKKVKRIKNVILNGAEKLFDIHPYEEISMNDIANEIALSRATLYNYFDKKEDIYHGILAKIFDDISDKYVLKLKTAQSEEEKHLLMARIILKKIRKHPLFYRIYLHFLTKIREFNISSNDLMDNFDFNIDYFKSQIPLILIMKALLI